MIELPDDPIARIAALVDERFKGAQQSARKSAYGAKSYEEALKDELQFATVGGVRLADLQALLSLVNHDAAQG